MNNQFGDEVFASPSAIGVIRRAQLNWIIYQVRVFPLILFTDFLMFFNEQMDYIIDLLRARLQFHNSFKLQFSLKLELVKFDTITNTHTLEKTVFNTHQKSILQGTHLQTMYNELVADIARSVEAFVKKGSNWAVKKVVHMDVNISNVNLFQRRGQAISPPDLPKALKRKHSIFKVTGRNDNDCFYTAITVGAFLQLHDIKGLPKNDSVVNDWEIRWRESRFFFKQPAFKSDDVRHSVSLDEIYKFENDNPFYRVVVLAYDEKDGFYPLRTFHNEGKYYRPIDELTVIPLLFWKQHYFPVSTLSALMDDHKKSRRHVCYFCLQYFKAKEHWEEHMKGCSGNYTQAVKMPEPNSMVEFQKYHAIQNHPFVIYADTEAILQPVNKVKGKTERLSKHYPSTAAYFLSISDDMKSLLDNNFLRRNYLPEYPNNLYKVFFGEDCMSQFLESLYNLTERIERMICCFYMPVNDFSTEWIDAFRNKEECYLCGKPFDSTLKEKRRVYDHDHVSGHIRGIAHSKCNIAAVWKKRFFPVIFHNWKNYDCHALCKTANFSSRDVSIYCIPQSSEKYMSVSLSWKVSDKKVQYIDPNTGYTKQRTVGLFNTLQFIDSFQFLSTSLDNLVKQLSYDADNKLYGKKTLEEHFPDSFRGFPTIDYHLFLRKGVFPYCYIDSFQKHLIVNCLLLKPLQVIWSTLVILHARKKTMHLLNWYGEKQDVKH